MKQIIMDVLDDMSESQINLSSEAARKTIAGLISATLNDRGRWIEFDEQTLNGQRAKESWVCDICGKNTYDVDWDYIGSGTNHLGCELKQESQEIEEIEAEFDDLQKQAYMEMTSDGLPEGGDAQAVKESHRLAEELVDSPLGYIYESPDGGETIFQRKVGETKRTKLTNEEWETIKNEKK